MQKWNLRVAMMLLIAVISSSGIAEDGSVNGEPEVVPAPIQDHISKIVEEDFSYNQTQRRLSQEVELAKLRLEMAKLKSEAAELVSPPLMTPYSAPVSDSDGKDKKSPPVTKASGEPKILMLSQLAGITRAAILIGDKTIFVRPGEVFPANGKEYTVQQGSGIKNAIVKEVLR
ncbi:hypothetical protein [Scandinavium lactucae]|uniref:Type IV pilus biogenesis protein PilP n=1 Tax=Scandinavium lactucae TaxID=3095028 RepID=A0ABU4QRY6_9ENTR|nr:MULTISPECIES: hypothetical protein [unclassified Scandinavium]MDX6040050.1 hypothetical protein [Scandinavium sp. V105_6]MDX6049492.1 hypothetical protein [Scandinavium sp. V105_1]